MPPRGGRSNFNVTPPLFYALPHWFLSILSILGILSILRILSILSIPLPTPGAMPGEE